MFYDRVTLSVRGGNGGRGCVSFHREKFVPRGGPDGGDGGQGGSVIFYVEPGETTLIQLHRQPQYYAENAGHGEPNRKSGSGGKDVRLPVPPGTIVYDKDSGEQVCELLRQGDEAVVAAGGRGGRGNCRFANSVNQVPNYAQPGEPGVERTIRVELKMVADIALVGFPNAGKSTLLNAITNARARIGEYPFTTLHPVLGTLPLEPDEKAVLMESQPPEEKDLVPRIILADIPGIVEGAHDGVGLGLEFLRHIERCEVLLMVVDVSVHREQEPLDAFRGLLGEIAAYQNELLSRPMVIALNKIDDPLMPEELEQIEEELKHYLSKEAFQHGQIRMFQISGKNGLGLAELRGYLFETVRQIRNTALDIPSSPEQRKHSPVAVLPTMPNCLSQ